MLHNLLTDPLIAVTLADGSATLSLPETMAACARDDVEDFPHIRAFQEHSWHAFLTQLATLAMVDNGLAEPPREPAAWRLMLEALTAREFPGQEPWHLAVEDQNRPAFLQPPTLQPRFTELAGRSGAGCPSLAPTPDDIDLPVNSRHHDVKAGAARNPDPDHWIFALVSCQTANGFGGNSLYGISRMNRGYGNRHGFSITPSTRWGAHITRDARILAQAHRGSPVRHLLLWTIPWQGGKDDSLDPETLHPWPLYIEVCRRLRLFSRNGGQLQAAMGTSKTMRIDARELNGLVEDPWTLQQQDKATTIAAAGFTCRTVTAFLNPEKNTLPLLARHHPETDGDSPMFLVGRALARGRGKTEGYHAITIPFRNETARMLDSGSRQEHLAQAAEARMAIIAELQRILNAALTSFTAMKNEAVYAFTRQMEEAVNPTFWAGVQDELASEDPEAARAAWAHQELIPAARRTLNRAQQSLAASHHTRYSAITASEGIYHGMLRNSQIIPQRPGSAGDSDEEEPQQ